MIKLLKFLAFLGGFSLICGLELGHIATLEAAEINSRIAGGDLAKEHQFPYQVGLSIEIVAGQFTWCGGSLIGQQWILTAAHCVDDITAITVYLGAVKRLEPQNIIKLTSSSVYLHGDWNSRTLVNDIALLYLGSPVAYTDAIRPVLLPRMGVPYSSYAYLEAIATGWGRMSDSSTDISNDLRYVKRFVESNDECQHVYGSSVRSTNVCIDTTGGKSTCTGDSGGPLVVHDDSGDVVLIGLTSFGKQAGCTKGFPAVFTRVTSYLDWIQNVSGVANL